MTYYTKLFALPSEAQREHRGYTFFARYYPIVPSHFSLDLSLHVIRYQDVTIGGAVILTDLIRQNQVVDFRQTFETLAQIAREHAEYRPCEGGTKTFYLDRIDRLATIEPLYIKWAHKNQPISVNECIVTADLALFDSIRKSLNTFRHGLCVPSQGDLHERNIFDNGTIIDFEGAGWNLVATDIATFIWHTLVVGNYFGPKYAKWANDDELRFLTRSLQEIELSPTKEVTIQLSDSRISLLNQFINHYVAKIPQINNDVLHQSTVAIAFRLLTTFPVDKMTKDDRHIIFSLANYFFSSEDTGLLLMVTRLLRSKVQIS